MKTTFCLAISIVVLLVLTSLAHAINYTRAWDDKISGATRWVVLTEFNRKAVFDKETGLVWEIAPNSPQITWYDAQEYCLHLTVGNRKGWRVPTIQELATLLDESAAWPPPQIPTRLPVGYPADPNNFGCFWSVTTHAAHPSGAWMGCFPKQVDDIQPLQKDYYMDVWCVRGGQGVDAQ
jgi:hypothetical protein